MTELITPISVDSSLREWRDHFLRKSFTLARATLRDTCEVYPRRPELWYLLGLTELAARDVSNAELDFRQLATMLESDDFEQSDFFRKNDRAIRALTPWVLEGLKNRSLYGAPYDPWLWLNNWEEIVKLKPTAAASLMFQPLGRTAPLADLSGSQTGTQLLPRLMDQLRVDPIRVDTMRGLLGKDANLTLGASKLRIMDNSVSIEKPLLPSPDGTPRPMPSVNIQRPRWDYAPPSGARTVSDLKPEAVRVPLPKMEPIKILPASLVFPKPTLPPASLPAPLPMGGSELPGIESARLSASQFQAPTLAPIPELLALKIQTKDSPGAPPPPVPGPPPITPPGKPAAAHPRKSPPGRTTAPAPGPSATVPAAPVFASTPRQKSPGTRPAEPSDASRDATFAGGSTGAEAAPGKASPWDDWEKELEALLETGAVTEALRRAAEAVEKYPRSARLEEFRAGLFERADRLEDAAKSYVAAYKKARESGAFERAEKILKKTGDLAARSGPLMFEIGALLAALGVTGVAATLLARSADHYRQRGDRQGLVKILDFLRRLPGTSPEVVAQAKRLESELGAVVVEARGPTPEVRSLPEVAQGRSAPPRSPVAPRVTGAKTDDEWRANRARRADVAAASRVPSRSQAATADAGDLQNLAVMLIVGIFVVIMSGLSGWIIPSLAGGVISFNMHQRIMQKNASPLHKGMSRLNLGVFGFAFFLSLIV